MSVLGLYRHEKIVEEETPKAPSAAVEMIALWTKDMEVNSYEDEPQPEAAEPVVDSSPESPESTVNNEILDKGEEIQDPEVQQIRFNGREFASRSLESAVKTLCRGREIAAAPVNLLDNTLRFVSVRALNSLPNFERRQPASEIENTDDEAIDNDSQETKKSHKNLIIAAGLGVLAVGTVVVGAYIVNKTGGSNVLSNPNAVSDHTPKELSLLINKPSHLHDAAVQVSQTSARQAASTTHHISQAADTFRIEPGHGFTQELADSFSSKQHKLAPEKAYKLYSALRQHFGDHGLLKHGKGLVDGTYIQGGELKIDKSGQAGWAQGVSNFAHTWLARNGSGS